MASLGAVILTPILVMMACVAVFRQGVQAYSIALEENLRSNLTHSYMTGVRPAGTVTIQVSFQLTAINKVDLKGEFLSLSGWWMMQWDDSRLSWDSFDHGGIGITTLYENDVWKPALVVSNSMKDLSAIQSETIPLRVFSTGTILWQPPGILQVSCEMDPTYFPFDTQTCSVQVTSFGFTATEVSLVSPLGIMRFYYQDNGEWEIVTVGSTSASFTDNNLSYGRLSFNITLKRRPGFYWLNVIFPVVVNGVLAMFLFLLPAESGEKMGYSLTVLLTYVVLMTLLSGGMPTSAKHTSLLEVYISLILGMSGVAILLAILNLAIYHTDDGRPVPGWAVALTSRLACLGRHGNGAGEGEGDSLPGDMVTGKSLWSRRAVHPGTSPATVKEKMKSLKSLESTEIESTSSPEVTWKEVAATMDKVCFWIYLVVIITLTMIFMPILMFGSG